MKYFTLESEADRDKLTLSKCILIVAVVIASLIMIVLLLYRGSDKLSNFFASFEAVIDCENYLKSEASKKNLDASYVTWSKCKYIGPSLLGVRKEIHGNSSRSGVWNLHDFEVYDLNGTDYKITLGSSWDFGKYNNEIQLYSMEVLR